MRELQFPAELELRADAAGGDGRTVDLRIVPFGVLGRTPQGLEMVERGAFEGTDPDAVVLRQDHADPPAGRGTSLEERDDGAYMSFRIARTPRGDELLANLAERMHRNASIGFEEIAGGSTMRAYRGEPVRVHRRLRLREVGTTWRPVYPEAQVLAVRAEDLEMPDGAPVIPEPAAPASIPSAAPAPIVQLQDPELGQLRARIVELEERGRQAIAFPDGFANTARRDEAIARGRWAQLALRSLAGERIDPAELAGVLPALQTRAIADVTTVNNLGVVPPQFREEMIGEINKSRPFLESTREVPAGASGLTFNFPKITQRPLVGTQTVEKTELPSRATIIGTVPFESVTIGGVGDLSIQLLRRSSPQFLTLWLDLLAEAYAIDADSKAIAALLAESTVNDGGTFNPAAPAFGEAFTNAAAVAPGSATLLPNRCWLSTAAIAAFIDAKSPTGGGGLPMYPGLVQIAGVSRAGDGSGPIPITMQPVWVPALDGESVDLIVGPARGFAWAEDGTYQLSADVPEKAGRDVGLVGMLWLMPIYPAAFTSYSL
jgi:HK97 family phage prohead protease